jgi:hypothetical protein
MKIKIEMEIDLENVFITAIEGGSNYWCLFDESSVMAVRNAVPRSVDACFSTACYTAVMEHKVRVPVYDVEDTGDEPIGWIDSSMFEERLTKMASDEGAKWALEAEVDESGDAATSDCVFQYLILGEVVYG